MSSGRAIGYRRLSPGDRKGDGLGLEAQRQAIAACAKRHALPLAKVFTDTDVSGGDKLESCPALLEAIGALSRGDILVVAKRDRLARDPIKAGMLEALAKRRGARIISAAGEGTEDDEPTSILIRRIMDAFAEFERLIIGARTRAALAVKRSRGERTGGVPFGWRAVGKKLAQVPHEQAWIGWLRKKRAGGASLREICRELERRKVPAKGGNRWHPETVRSILSLRRPGETA